MEAPGELTKRSTIIVCTVDRTEELDQCLGSLLPFREAGAEIIAVNNGYPSRAMEEISKRHGAQFISEPRRGLSHARNAGIRAATGSILAFLDDDSRADPSWIPRLLAPLSDPQVLAVVGSVRAQTVADPVSQIFDHIYLAGVPDTPLLLDAPRDLMVLPLRMAMQGKGSNMAVRREVFDRFGQFDTRFGRGTRIGSGEETDLLLAVLLGGGKIMVAPAARIFHRHPTEQDAIRRWAFRSSSAHTAILTKYFFREPGRRGQILRYAVSRLRPQPKATADTKPCVPRIPLWLGSIYGPLAFLLAGK